MIETIDKLSRKYAGNNINSEIYEAIVAENVLPDTSFPISGKNSI